MQRKWYLSSSNLRLCLGLFERYDLSSQVAVAQFQWIYMTDTFYLYNTRSSLILATVKHSGMTSFIRFRQKSRYAHIIEKWARSFNRNVLVVPSAHVGRWERRARYNRMDYIHSREESLHHYVEHLYSQRLDTTPEYLSEGKLRRRPRAQDIVTMRVAMPTNFESLLSYGEPGEPDETGESA